MAKFTKNDFTEDELMLLRIAFNSAQNVTEELQKNGYDSHLVNELFHLEEKLGIYNLVSDNF